MTCKIAKKLCMRKFQDNYFVSSFFWSTLSKVLNAIFGFVSVPILLGYFGKADYGLISIATACNGCMQLMDLGMNTGAVKFYSQWIAEGKKDLIQKVSNTNVSFYLIISLLNIVGLLVLAYFGESLFAISHEQFLKLRTCFFILMIFSSFSWVSSAYTQLLTAYKKIAFTMQVNCVMLVLRILLVVLVLVCKQSLIEYFFYLTALVAACFVPNIVKCKKDGLLDSLKPANHWNDFKQVLSFSFSIFLLSLFQVIATQSRPIVLSVFSEKGDLAVADYRILEVIPLFIIMLCGSLTAIFLPKASEMLVKCSKQEIQEFVNVWTKRTTVLVCILCFPFIIAAEDIISAYVGIEYADLGKWLRLWCFFLIVQMHSTPAFSIILARGKTFALVVATAIVSVVSIFVNVELCALDAVGSAVLGYVVYMLCLIGVYYFYIYNHYIGLNRLPILKSFLLPLFIGLIACLLPYGLSLEKIELFSIDRFNFLALFLIKTLLWLLLYVGLLFIFRIFKLTEFKR